MEGENSVSDNPTPETTQAPQGGREPGPVPYGTFAATNKALRAAEAELARLQPLATEAEQLRQQLESANAAIETAKAAGAVKLDLALAGAEGSYLDYLAGRYLGTPAEGRPSASDWAAGLKESERAFFRASSPAPTTLQPPKTNPDNGTLPAHGDGADPPLTDELIARMDMADYQRRRDEIMAWMTKKRAR